jgi:hypothetical protein
MALQGLFGVLLSQRAKLEQTVISQLSVLLEPYQEFLDSTKDPESLRQFCPTPEQLLILIATKDNIESSVIALQRRVTSLQTILQRVQVVLIAIPPIIAIIKALPTPNQFTTTGFVLTLGDRLEKVKELSQKYRGEVAAGTFVLSTINSTFATILGLLQSLDRIIEICAPNLVSENEEIRALSQSLNQSITQFNNSYREYKIEIRVVDRQAVAPQRYAVAIDRLGVVVLEGRPSFSSSTQVLVDEIKFRIDQLII